jgi:Bacterial SH3 domain
LLLCPINCVIGETKYLVMKHKSDWPVGIKGIVGIAGCLTGLAVVYFGHGIGTESPKKDAAAEPVPAARSVHKRPGRAMNLALGNMVYFAQDLGFVIRPVKGEAADMGKIAARIEGQLKGIRELYRREIEKNAELAGSLTLTFNVDASGEVSHVGELSSRLQDGEFKNAVASEVSKWSFADVVTENLNVTCPLLFVQEGMDITTLVNWEKSLGSPAAKASLVRTSDAANPNSPQAVANATATPAAKPAGRDFQIKYATSLRGEPNFSAVTLTSFAMGTKVRVLGKQGDWLQVRSLDNTITGFIRKEFVAPVDVARK